MNELAKEDVSKRIQEGKFERAKTKEEREQESMLFVGGRKKNKGKKPKAKDTVVEEAFNIDITIITKFSLVNVSPPMGAEDLDKKIDELRKKREEYLEEG